MSELYLSIAYVTCQLRGSSVHHNIRNRLFKMKAFSCQDCLYTVITALMVYIHLGRLYLNPFDIYPK